MQASENSFLIRLDRELDFILSQQQELEEVLAPLEDQIKAQQSIPYMQHTDLEREKTYVVVVLMQLLMQLLLLADRAAPISCSLTYGPYSCVRQRMLQVGAE